MKILPMAFAALTVAGFASAAMSAPVPALGDPDKELFELYSSSETPEGNKTAIKRLLDGHARKRAQIEKIKARRRNPNAAPGAVNPPELSRLVTPALGGQVRRGNGSGVFVPPGAVTANLMISMKHAPEDANRGAKAAQSGLHSVSSAVDFKPENAAFKVPATIVLAYEPERLGGASGSSLKIFRWNAATSLWEPLPSRVDAEKRTVTASTTQLAVYQVLAPGAGR